MGDPTSSGPLAIIPTLREILRRLRKLESGNNGVVTVRSLIASMFVRSPGVRTTIVTDTPVPLYIDAAGNFGISASIRAKKNIGSDYAVDMPTFLAIVLKNWTYIENPDSTGMGPIADDLHEAGLTEFVVYNPNDESIMGVRTDALLIGLWSAVVQSREDFTTQMGLFDSRISALESSPEPVVEQTTQTTAENS